VTFCSDVFVCGTFQGGGGELHYSSEEHVLCGVGIDGGGVGDKAEEYVKQVAKG